MALKNYPTLYKRTSTGAIQSWQIAVDGTTIVTTYGQVGGKMQTTKDSVKSGKSQGKRNETEADEQAAKEAKSKWTKQKKAGYVESQKDAMNGKTDALIEGGVLPMLAKVYEEHVGKVSYPIAVQPKLDGHRCLAVIDDNGKVSLWTRTRKRMTSVPHIVEKLEYIASKIKLRGCVLDGEIYVHTLKEDFERITSLARRQEASEESKELQYHVYDIVDAELGFKERISKLANLVLLGGDAVHLVETKFAESGDEAAIYFTLFRKLGYEGSMVRLLGQGYENKRSAQLLKVKSFLENEFRVVGVEEGRGKLQGHAGAFVCVTDGGEEFRAKMEGSTSKLKEYFSEKEKYIGQMLTVKYQGITSGGVPRFPVGKAIRDYE